jgi:hypothetical protein
MARGYLERVYLWQMHRTLEIGMLGLLCLPCMACTRDNPAFDTQLSTTEATGPGDGDGDASTTLDERDLPSEPACEFQPRDGLSIVAGGPDDFGGDGAGCPIGVTMWMKVVGAQGGVVEVEVCPEGCQFECTGATLSLSLFPIDVSTHIPAELGKCMALEAGGSLGDDGSACYWGAMTIYDSVTNMPYVIATAHSYEPTPAGIEMLAGAIPMPEKAGTCNCEAIGQGNDCCYGADTPPSFLGYEFESGPVLPGGSTELTLANSLGIGHTFELQQAQHIHSCESPDVELSWAVLADFF